MRLVMSASCHEFRLPRKGSLDDVLKMCYLIPLIRTVDGETLILFGAVAPVGHDKRATAFLCT